MKYLPEECEIHYVSLEGGENLKIKIRPPGKIDKFVLMYIFRYRGAEYILTLHPLPYGDNHIVVGKHDRKYKQKLESQDDVEIILRLAHMFGEGYESYFSGVGFGSEEFHAHFFARENPLWLPDNKHIKLLQSHLHGIKKFEGKDLKKLKKEIYGAYDQ